MQVTYTGATNGFFDTGGAFGYFTERGSGGTSALWTATFTYDSEIDLIQTPDYERSAGGSAATFSLNGYTVDIGGTGLAERYLGPPPQSFRNNQGDGSTSLSVSFFLPLGMTVPTLDEEYPYFYQNEGVGMASITGQGFYGLGYVRSVEIHALAVPEPEAWAFMLMGFGGIGAVIRRGNGLRPSWAR